MGNFDGFLKGKLRTCLDTILVLGWNAKDFHNYFVDDKPYEAWLEDGKIIHIDHIIPLCLYQLTGEDDPNLTKAWRLRNLQMITAQENWDKHDDIPWDLIQERNLFDLLPENAQVSEQYRKAE